MSSLYYVYLHRSPDTKEIVYIGFGTKERAWNCRKTHRRNNEHLDWLAYYDSKGYTMDEIVEISFKSRDREAALEMERKLIDTYRPKFNYTEAWSWCMSLTPEQIVLARSLREDGLSYSNIATEIGSSAMTVYRLLNGQTKGYNDNEREYEKVPANSLLAGDPTKPIC